MSELNFRIESSAKAFEILASNLYSDKISAVIRELSCNAADAHVEAGVANIPFNVDLPNNTNKQFRIRDFGLGLKLEQIEDVFTVFFSSTKTTSKAYTGAFGLGCKSPFAISDEFFVNSYIDGLKYSFQCYKKEGIPSIIFLKKEETTEESGLEIIVQLKSFIQKDWENKAKNIYEFFHVRPNLNTKLSYFSESPEHKIDDNWENTDSPGVWIVMSNVRYRLDTNKVGIKQTQNRSRGICYHVPPRSVDVTPSREELAYTEQTINFISKFIAKVNQKFTDDMQKTINKYESKMKAQIEFIKFKNKFSEENIFDDMNANASNFYWRGEPLSSTRDIKLIIDYPVSIEIGTYFKASRYSANVKEKLHTKTPYNIGADVSEDALVFMINDTKASQEALRSWVSRHQKNNNLYSFTALVIKSECEFILTDNNKIDGSNVIRCSQVGLQKKSIKTIKKSVKEFSTYFYDYKLKYVMEVDDKEETDAFEQCLHQDHYIYFIPYDSMVFSSPQGIYLRDNDHSRINLSDLLIRTSFIRMDEDVTKKYELPSKILLIKNTKKSRDFMRKYTKENHVKFISFQTLMINTTEKYMEDYPESISKRINYLCLKTIAEEWKLDKLNSENDYFLNKYCDDLIRGLKLNICFNYIINNFKSFEIFAKSLPKLNPIIDFIESNFLSSSVAFDCIFTINHFRSTMANCNQQKFLAIIEQFSGELKEFYNNFKNMIESYPTIFMDEANRTKKIVEYYAEGKMT